MTSITTTLGAGSGIDTQALVTSLVAAQRAPKDAALTARETTNTARISALATITSSIDTFSTSLGTLISGGTLFTQPTSSDTAIASVSAVAGTRLGAVSSELEVKSLAQPQTLTSAALTAGTSNVGQGTLTVTVGGKATDIAIDGTNDSLAGLAKAINGANIGLSANVVTGSAGAQLVVKGQTGAASSFTIALKDGDAAALGRFAYDGTTTTSGQMTQTKAAQDASLVLDGIATTRATNSIDDLIPGAKIDLGKAAAGTIVQIGSVRPTSSIQSAISDFVSAFNTLVGQMTAATAAATTSTSTDAGALRGDRGIADAKRQLAQLTSTPLTGAATGPRTLAEIGVSTNRDGTLSLDATRLSAQIAAYPDAVEGMFNPTQISDSPFITIASAAGAAKAGTYTIANAAPATDTTAASAIIGGFLATSSADGTLTASAYSPAKGLSIKASAAVTSATVTVELGLGGALQAIRDSLRGTAGSLTADSTSFQTETDAIATDRAAVSAYSTTYQDRLTTAYARMDTRVAAYKATQSYLTQQIALWTSSDS